MSNLSEPEDIFEDVSNPLDSVEDIFYAHDWAFDRLGENELHVQISGKMGEYRLFFQWEEDRSAMHFRCELADIEVGADVMDDAARAMTTFNTDMWCGHFAFRSGSRIPCFRHTTLFRGMTQTSGAEHIEDLVEIALNECERFYPVFDLYGRGACADDMQLSLALMPVAGES